MSHRKLRDAFWLMLMLSLTGCVHFGVQAYDRRPLIIHSYYFFNQAKNSRLSQKPWNGDWIFRRARLELIDSQLREMKPDVLVLQGVMQRIGSPADADKFILKAGSLAEYDWYSVPFLQTDVTQEEESLSIAVGFPLRIDRARTGTLPSSFDSKYGRFAISVVELDEQPVILVNVDFNSTEQVFDALDSHLEVALEQLKLCKNRVIVAGRIPFSLENQVLKEFKTKYALKDSSLGYCEIEADCHTATPLNNLFVAVEGDRRPSREDSVLLPQEAFVYFSRVTFDKFIPATEYVSQFGIESLFGSTRYGWTTQAKLPLCSESF